MFFIESEETWNRCEKTIAWVAKCDDLFPILTSDSGRKPQTVPQTLRAAILFGWWLGGGAWHPFDLDAHSPKHELSVTWLAETLSMTRRRRCRSGLYSVNCVFFLYHLAHLMSLIFLALARDPQLKVVLGKGDSLWKPLTGKYDESISFGIGANPLVYFANEVASLN